MRLYSYFRSSASFRVRIALNLKGLDYDYVPVHLVRNEQFAPGFRQLNADALVPVLVDGPNQLSQSLAIIEYLDEIHPQPALLPGDAVARARVRALALMIACEIHPLNNLRVLRYLTRDMGLDEAAKDQWYRHWIESGFTALEQQLAQSPATGRFCHGDTPTMADVLLVPQIFNAQRMQCNLGAMPTLMRIHDACMALDAFERAAPGHQPDAA